MAAWTIKDQRRPPDPITGRGCDGHRLCSPRCRDCTGQPRLRSSNRHCCAGQGDRRRANALNNTATVTYADRRRPRSPAGQVGA